MREIRGAVSPDCGPENYDFIVADVLTRAAAAALTGRFVEVEDEAGRSVDVGDWIERDGGYWALRIQTPSPSVE
jgi:hypothetical protein